MQDSHTLYENYDDYLNNYPTVSAGSIRAFEYTANAIRKMDQILSSIDFEERDAECIFSFLENEIEAIPFHAYLKRYIFLRSESRGFPEDFSDKDYQWLIRESFYENRTPFSWQPTVKKPGSIIRSWLERDLVRRKTVFLLGFGLRMKEEDVSDFLMKGIRDVDFDFFCVEEAVCWHCYHCGKRFPDYLALMKAIDGEEDPRGDSSRSADYWEAVGRHPEAYLFDEEKLISYGKYLRSRSEDDRSAAMEEYRKILSQLEDHCDKGEGSIASRIENSFLMGIPRNSLGNIQRVTDSALARSFALQRMSRQRIDSILKGRQAVTRFDLITLTFFIYSRKKMDPNRRRDAFIFAVNHSLIQSRMCCLLFSSPYEAFLTMCLVTDNPLDTYSSVWEISYDEKRMDTE